MSQGTTGAAKAQIGQSVTVPWAYGERRGVVVGERGDRELLVRLDGTVLVFPFWRWEVRT